MTTSSSVQAQELVAPSARMRRSEPDAGNVADRDLSIDAPSLGAPQRTGDLSDPARVRPARRARPQTLAGVHARVLLEQVWGYRHAADTRLVNVHVQRLRSKVENDPERPEIVVTVRGVGYKAGPA